MSGGSGPIVTDQMPLSPLVIGCGLPSSSPLAVTCCALGAKNRTVTLPSAATSGDAYAGPPRPPPRPPGGAPAGGWAIAIPPLTPRTITIRPSVRRITGRLPGHHDPALRVHAAAA